MEEKIDVVYKKTSVGVSIYRENRSDEWVLFLHGIQSSKNLFKNLLKQKFLQKYSLLAIDLVGFGKSDKPENFSYDLKDQSYVCEQVIRRLGIRKLHIVGHSLGGMIGILIAEQLKDITISLINMEGNLILADSGVSKIVSAQTFEEFQKTGYKKLKKEIEISSEMGSKKRLEWLEEIPDFVFYLTSSSIIKWAKSEKLLKMFLEVSIKKLFIYGERNYNKSKVLSDSVKRIGISNAGHFMLIENPEDSFEAIENFLNT